ncbi:unnamed protein product (macronuclear) [Paramecium tetraurelia]|uniref:Transmembrane protein n=1 Tax=Paramecium tetraurelia TaxID=5888 RepID=A0EES5_PARTE|nr:uncharacterized protein GSPATT00026139001 [Paramecium tetraurelia]CAK93816.1 unnamed protein product [Paramecium tetraurelia]|eukprot:XP_001461189.1 hypothetical protein (macronuclear) [Paramecium tetraurelia strain d4-2]
MERYYYLSKFCYYINTSIIITFTTFCILLFIFQLSFLFNKKYISLLKLIQKLLSYFQINHQQKNRMLHYHSKILVMKIESQDFTANTQHFLNVSQNQYYTGTSSGLISKASILYYYLIRDSQRSNPLPEYCLCISFSPYLQQARNQGKHNNVINTDLIRSEIYNNRDQDSTAQIPNRPLIVILFFRIEFKPILVSSGLEIPITNLCCCKVVKKLSWSCKMGYSFKSVSMNSHSFSFDEVE